MTAQILHLAADSIDMSHKKNSCDQFSKFWIRSAIVLNVRSKGSVINIVKKYSLRLWKPQYFYFLDVPRVIPTESKVNYLGFSQAPDLLTYTKNKLLCRLILSKLPTTSKFTIYEAIMTRLGIWNPSTNSQVFKFSRNFSPIIFVPW